MSHPNVAFIYNTPHPAHRVFAEAVDADFYPVTRGDAQPAANGLRRLLQYFSASASYPTDYDYYLIEGGRPLVPARLFSLRNPDATVVLLNADETLINQVERLDTYGSAETLLHRLSLGAVDGVLSVGPFVDEYRERAGLDVPSRIVHPCIQPDVFETLGGVEPATESKSIVSIGKAKPAVGFDILVEAFGRVREDHPSAELHVGGEGHPTAWNDRPGVTVHGWVDDLGEFFAQGAVSAHPGRSECFPVATLEPLRAGCPCIVSHSVGTKSVMSGIDPNLVAEPTVSDTARALDWYFGLEADARRHLAAKARRVADRFTADSVGAEFAARFDDLTAELDA